MSVPTYEVLPIGSGLGLPQAVRAALVAFGAASNQAALALGHAQLAESTAITARSAIDARPHGDGPEAATADLLARSALSYVDQLTVVYTITVSRHAAYAAAVATALVRGTEPLAPSTTDLTLLPSRILSALDDVLPPVQLAAAGDDPAREQDQEVSDARATVVNVVRTQLAGVKEVEYDDPAQVASRSPEAFDVVAVFPEALHAYAGALTWAIGVAAGYAPLDE